MGLVMGLKISADQINRRLGGGQGYQTPPPKNDDGNGGNSVLYAGMAATFIAIGAATFFWDSLPMPNFSGEWKDNSYVSVADAICKPMWREKSWNSDAVACYLVEMPDRFCNSQEREHLVEVFTRFRTDIELAKAAAIHEVTFEQKKIFDNIVADIERQEKGLPAPKVQRRPKNKYLPNPEIEVKVAEFQKQVFNPSARGGNKELSRMLRKILEKGYFKTWEFGMIRDKIVVEALKQPLPEVQSPCEKEKS